MRATSDRIRVGFTPAPGSSSRMTWGSPIRTRASSSSFFWPPESVSARSSFRVASSMNSRISRARTRMTRSSRATFARPAKTCHRASPVCPLA